MLSDTSINVSPTENQETGVPDSQSVSSASAQSLFPNKYIFDAFAGYEGERLLKSILHKILPMALFRTWEVLVDRQAPGNDCFLSIASISETTQRVERTIRLNIHEFEKRQLMVLRPEQKVLRQADGTQKLKLVVVKDFTNLYALALEYLLWTQSEEYIEPERDFAEAIRSNEALKRKLVRFNNYRRIITNQVPGPKPMEREEHRWYTDYNASLDSQELGTVGGTATPPQGNAGQAEEAEGENTTAIRKHNLPKQLQEDLKKVSEERTTTSTKIKQIYGDSFDSGIPQGEGGGQGYTNNPTISTPQRGVREDSLTPTNQTNPTNPSPLASGEMGGAKQASNEKQAGRKERADLDERAQAFVRQAMAAYQGRQEKPGAGSRAATPNVRPNALVSAFVREFASLFHDRNVKASHTRALRTVEYTQLSQKAILAALVKAYLVALDTKTVKPQHRHPDGDNKMPLFCTMFARFVEQATTGSFGYGDEHLARDIAADDRLVLFVVEHQLEATLLEEAVAEETQVWQEQPEDRAQDDGAFVKADEIAPDPSTQDEVQMEAEQAEQRNWIVEDPRAGWSSYENASWWGERLREHMGSHHYNYGVWPTQYGRFIFVLFERANPSQYWEFFNKDEVNQYL